MRLTSTARMLASALSMVSYILLTHDHLVGGVSLNLVCQILLLPFALTTAAYDMVVMCGVFGVINLQTLLSHLL